MNNDSIFEFLREVTVIEQLTRTRIDRVLPHGLTASQFALLSHLMRQTKAETPAELADAFQLTRPTMTNTLQKLEAKGMIKITSSTQDRRGKYVEISAHGRKAFQQSLGVLQQTFEPLLEALDRSPFERALPHLKKIRQQLDQNR